MSKISDIIERFINELIEESEGQIEIQRNELANQFNCAPSQINYVLTTRFTIDRGYTIESKRGGGGCIKITRVVLDRSDYIYNILSEKIGGNISKRQAFELIEVLLANNFIDMNFRNILRAIVDDNIFYMLDDNTKNIIRASILKSALVAAFSNRRFV